MSESLISARKAVGWTRLRLAREAGLDKNAVYDIESGKNAKPSHFLVTRLVTALQRAGLAVTAEGLFPVPAHIANGTDLAAGVQPESVREGSAK